MTPYTLARDDTKIPCDGLQRGRDNLTCAAKMSWTSLHSAAGKHLCRGPVLLDTLRQQYHLGQTLMCSPSYSHKTQLRLFGFGSHMNDNDPVPFPLPTYQAAGYHVPCGC